MNMNMGLFIFIEICEDVLYTFQNIDMYMWTSPIISKHGSEETRPKWGISSYYNFLRCIEISPGYWIFFKYASFCSQRKMFLNFLYSVSVAVWLDILFK